jgi:cytochrome c-type biogenesis protein CcsB
MTWVWIFYALAMIPLLLSIVFRWKPAYWIGLVLFLGSLGVHTFAVGLRWYVSQRWPNSNMFEAITTAAFMGGCIALLIEVLFARRSPMRGLFALGSCVASMTAMMAVKMFPIELNANISNMMPVLNDLWLYIHTNVIILSYCLIFIAAVTAAIYLIYRAVLFVKGTSGVNEYARVGGAGSLILTKPDGSSYLDEAKSTFGQVLDGTTMVVMELSFILLWSGLVMGAIWADHSWGRPWGWDPKEVFALNTFLVFLVLVHGRLKVKDKGLWTAALALVGAGVMLFNWIIINFAISGLHSYA